jgi:hypothetical protein
MSNENKNTTPAATYEDKVKFIEEAIEVGIKMDELMDKINKMNVKDSIERINWDSYKKSIWEAWGALRIASIKSASILLER